MSKPAATIPYDFQRQDVRTVWTDFGGRGGLFHSQGLGKTFMALWGARRYLNSWPVLVVCPTIAKLVWKEEARRHLGLDAHVLYHRAPSVIPTADVYIVNYDILGLPRPRRKTWVNFLTRLHIKLLIIDECQEISNRDSIRSQACRELARNVPYLLALSGTPIENRPSEFFAVLNMINREEFPSFRTYAEEFCGLKRAADGRGWDASGATNLQELNRRVFSTSAVRRRKEDVLDDLPPKTVAVEPVELASKDMTRYRELESGFVRWYRTEARELGPGRRGTEAMSRKTLLKSLVGELKFPLILEWVKSFLDNSGEKLMVFGWHRQLLSDLYQALAGYNPVIVWGGQSDRDRNAAITSFNGDPACRLWVGNLKAGGVAWSCTSCSTQLHCELSWTPTHHAQAADRCRGIARGTGRPVTVHVLVAEGTIESDLCRINQYKEGVTTTILDGGVRADAAFRLQDELDKAILRRNKR